MRFTSSQWDEITTAFFTSDVTAAYAEFSFFEVDGQQHILAKTYTTLDALIATWVVITDDNGVAVPTQIA